MTTQVTSQTILAMLGVDIDDSPYAQLRAADGVHQSVGVLLLSAWQREGIALSPTGTAVLNRQRRRIDGYAEALALLNAAGVPARVVKGVSIARHYPTGLLRAQTDLDLTVPTPADVWRAAEVMRDANLMASVDVTVVEADTTELYIAIGLPAEDPFFDKPRSIEISTVLHYGDSDVVPLRRSLPDDQPVADVLALCEERFQRPFHVRDAVDLHLLAPLLHHDLLLDAVQQYELAPELLELLDLTLAAALAEPIAALRGRISADADTARRRRQAQRAAAPSLSHGFWASDHAVPAHLASPLPVDVEGARVLLTPVGSFVLVRGSEITPEELELAQTAIAHATGQPAKAAP